MWLARDKDGELNLFIGKPWKVRSGGYWNTYEYSFIYEDEDNDFSDVKWTDNEPTEVKLAKRCIVKVEKYTPKVERTDI